MQRTLIQLTEDEFDTKYPLVRNHIDPNASWSDNEGPGCLFETYGEEVEFVRQQDPLTIWTVIDGDDDDMYITSGYHFVNRLGYLISTVPVPPDVDIEVRIPRSDDSELEIEEENASPIEDTPQGIPEVAFELLDKPSEGLKTVGDFESGEQAEELFACITGQIYTRQVGTTGGSNDE